MLKLAHLIFNTEMATGGCMAMRVPHLTKILVPVCSVLRYFTNLVFLFVISSSDTDEVLWLKLEREKLKWHMELVMLIFFWTSWFESI